MTRIYSNRTSLLQQCRQFALDGLQVGVAADVLLVDEDVGHGPLVGELLESVLDVLSVI